jgi:disulfide bond formation protein DsbB
MTPANAMKLNAVALYAISAVLLVAFYFQFALGELPRPLCLLKRVAFTALAVGPILTLRHGPRPGHYGLIVLAALFGAAIASRQVLLHIMQGDWGYGSALLGYRFLHLGVFRLCRGDRGKPRCGCFKVSSRVTRRGLARSRPRPFG